MYICNYKQIAFPKLRSSQYQVNYWGTHLSVEFVMLWGQYHFLKGK